MILKIIGFLMVTASTSLTGYYMSILDKYRLDDLESMKRLLVIFKSEISYWAMPLSEAFKEISQRVSEPLAAFSGGFSKRLENKTGDSASDIWIETLNEHSAKFYYTRDDFEAFESFGRTLGYMDKQQQLNNIELTILYINQTMLGLDEKIKKNSRMYRSMGVLIGVLISVILF